MRIMTDTLLFLLQLGLCVCFKMLDKDSAAHTTCQGCHKLVGQYIMRHLFQPLLLSHDDCLVRTGLQKNQI